MAFDKNEFRKKAKAKAVRERVERIRKRLSESGDFPSDGTEGPKSAAEGSQEDTGVEGHGGNKGQASKPVAEKKISAEERRVLEQYRKWKKQREGVEEETPGADMEPEKDKHARNAGEEVTNESRKDRTKAIREKIRKRLAEEDGDPGDLHDEDGRIGPGDDATASNPGKKGDADKVGSAPKKTLEARSERVARIRRKLEKRARIEKIKERIAEKREKDNDVNSSEKIREEASALKKRIARVRKMLKEQDMGMAQPQQPAGDPQSQMMDPGMGMEQGMEQQQQLPPEIVAEIQNISSAAQNLASLAGIQPEPDMGADVEAGVPAETGAGVEGAEDQMVLESTEKDPKKKAKILESIRARKQMEDADNLVESTRDRVEKRRKALKELREKALNEDYKSEGAEETTAQVEKEVAAYMGNDHNDPNVVVHQQGRKIDGPSPSQPGSAKLKPAKTWPTKPSKQQKFEAEEYDEKDGEQMDEETRSWDEKHIDHYIERKELSFKDMMQKGLLG